MHVPQPALAAHRRAERKRVDDQAGLEAVGELEEPADPLQRPHEHRQGALQDRGHARIAAKCADRHRAGVKSADSRL